MDNGTAIITRSQELTPQQRAAKLTYLLMQGGTYTNRQVADMFGITIQGAICMMDTISGAIPITKTHEHGGKWQRFDIS